MDYSTISTDPDLPTGTSPWGSPRVERGTFPTSNNDIPSSPLPGQEQSADVGRVRNGEPQSPDLSAQLQSAQLGDPDYPEEHPPFGVHQSPNVQQQQSPTPAQYQTGARQDSRPPAPAYRIQGKITGLERTGKKDPILRFDVHVGLPLRLFYAYAVANSCFALKPDQYPQVPHDSVPRCASDPFRICQARRPPSLRQPGSSGPCRAIASDAGRCRYRGG